VDEKRKCASSFTRSKDESEESDVKRGSFVMHWNADVHCISRQAGGQWKRGKGLDERRSQTLISLHAEMDM
jgi:hypothetical protein